MPPTTRSTGSWSASATPTPRAADWASRSTEVVEAGGRAHRRVLVRSTEFPSNPKTAIAKQIGKLITRGGRRVVVEDSDWRAMLALPPFRDQHQDDPACAAWLEAEQAAEPPEVAPHDPGPRSPAGRSPRSQPPPPAPSRPDRQAGSAPTDRRDRRRSRCRRRSEPIVSGHDRRPGGGAGDDRPRGADAPRRVPGGHGSGKTTVALNLVEQLLLRGVPAILVDRKGDLCGYARPESWPRPLDDPTLAERARAAPRAGGRRRLHAGQPAGPAALDRDRPGRPRAACGSFEREQVARYAAAALAG